MCAYAGDECRRGEVVDLFARYDERFLDVVADVTYGAAAHIWRQQRRSAYVGRIDADDFVAGIGQPHAQV